MVTFFSSASLLWLLPAITGAVQVGGTGGTPEGVPKTLQDLYNVVCRLANWFFLFVMVIAIIVLLMGAIQFYLAGGNEQKVSKARQYLYYALVGVAIAILSKSFVFIVGDLLGVTNVASFFQCQ